MKEFMESRQIDSLFHFTRASNLPTIMEYGLLPKSELISRRIVTEYNDDYRYDNCENALCMSIEFPNYKMFYTLRMGNTEVDWAVLKLDASILLDFDCAYCVTNAGSQEAYSLPLEERMGRKAFKKLYKDYPGKPTREEMHTKPWYPTNPQAEVLVFGCIPLEYIDAICFENKASLREFAPHIPDVIEANTNSRWFQGREDWRHWQN